MVLARLGGDNIVAGNKSADNLHEGGRKKINYENCDQKREKASKLLSK